MEEYSAEVVPSERGEVAREHPQNVGVAHLIGAKSFAASAIYHEGRRRDLGHDLLPQCELHRGTNTHLLMAL